MAATTGKVRCTYCGGRSDGGAPLEVDLRMIRYDYCDAACATAHGQAVELTALGCGGCDEPAVGDTGCCDEHLVAPAELVRPAARVWRKAG
jgi:hypothetical protein